VKVFYVRAARNDLAQIWLACAQRSGRSLADKLVGKIEETVERTVGAFPTSGRLRPELGDAVRSFPVVPYVAFYQIKRSRIVILRVLHGHRDLRRPLASLIAATA
jgi:toxin ParE1/3/4